MNGAAVNSSTDTEGIQETIARAGEAGINIKSIQADLSSDEAVDKAMKETLNFCKPQYLANMQFGMHLKWLITYRRTKGAL